MVMFYREIAVQPMSAQGQRPTTYASYNDDVRKL